MKRTFRRRAAIAMLSITMSVISFTVAAPAFAAETLVPWGSSWRYLDDGSDAGSSWIETSFADDTWAEGPAELGYGDGDEATIVSFGPDPYAKYITTYFRSTFAVSDPSAFTGLVLNLRDDGAIVYLNGTEVFRSNMPATSVGYLTLAASTIGGLEETTPEPKILAPAALVAGSNLLAVELHQRSGTSSDVSFDLELVALTPADPLSVLRGPYLQQVTPTGAVVRWRTDALVDSRVRYGLDPAALDFTVDDGASVSDHEIAISGLDPGTRYYYSVGTSTETLTGGDADHSFETAPDPSTPTSIRIWALGDSGTADASAAAVRDAYFGLDGADGTDIWLMLGDNAYGGGTDGEYQAAVFDMYPSILRRFALWPTLGNHDGRTASSAFLVGPYYEAFTLPIAGEAGGLASGTEAYYSFDHGNVHLICLDSHDSDRSPGSAMLTWLENDLIATDRDWIIAFWHHPPYSHGSHDSDDPLDSEGRLFDMRENVLPILEDGGVDLVLCGHSHSYERTMLLDGHYGVSSTLSPTMIVDDGDGRPTGDGAYFKPSAGLTPHEGAVYVVAGSSGKTSFGTFGHPAMVISLQVLGSMVLDISGNRLDARFLRHTSAIGDDFTIVKGAVFVRGDANADGVLDVADAVTTLGFLFQSFSIGCELALDANDDEGVDIADAIYALSHLFTGGPPPTEPYPGCGEDPTLGAVPCFEYSGCP